MPTDKQKKPTLVSFDLMRRVSKLQLPSAAALIALALEPADVRDFALYVTALPCHHQTRKGAHFMDSKILQAQPKDKWLPRFQTNLYPITRGLSMSAILAVVRLATAGWTARRPRGRERNLRAPEW